MKGLGRRLLVGLLLGLAVAIGLMVYSDARALARVLTTFDVRVVPAVLGLSLVGYALRVLKWEVYLDRLDLRMPRTESTLAFVAGLVMAISPGKVGEVLKSFLLRRSRGIPVARTAPIVVAERLTDLIALLALAAWGVATLGHGAAVVVGGALFVGALLVLIGWPPAGAVAVAVVRRLPWVGGVAPRLDEARVTTQQLIGPRVLLATTALSVLAWGCEALGTWLVIEAFPGVTNDLGKATFVFAFATVAGALSMLPGGLVATEGSMIALLAVVFHMVPNEQVATAVTLLVRFATLWFGVGLGAVALVIYQRRYLGGESLEREDMR